MFDNLIFFSDCPDSEVHSVSDGHLCVRRFCYTNKSDKLIRMGKLTALHALLDNATGRIVAETRWKRNPALWQQLTDGESVVAEDFVCLQCDNNRILTIAFLETSLHLAEIHLQRMGSKVEIEVVCDLHPACLEPQEQVFTQQLALYWHRSFNCALEELATLLQRYQHVEAPSAPPIVASTWHYYARWISQQVVDRELAAMHRRCIPADVFQIDGGWYNKMGDWDVDLSKFPEGLEGIVRSICSYGLVPGIWLAALMVANDSLIATAHPDWLLRHTDGTPVPFNVSQKCSVLDTSLTAVQLHLESLFRSLRSLGFCYFKIDFSRAILMDEEAVPQDGKCDLMGLYRRGFEAIRRGIGPDAHMNICGGHFGGGLGLANSFRTGSDTYARWIFMESPASLRMLQAIRRSHYGRLFNTDPDSMALRLNDKAWADGPHGQIPLGDYTLNEARAVIVNQFITGGMTSFGDPMEDLPDERLLLMRRVIPSPNTVSLPQNYFHGQDEPDYFVIPLDGYNLLAALNHTDADQHWAFDLTGDAIRGISDVAELLVIDMDLLQPLGIFASGEHVDFGMLPARDGRVLKILPIPADEAPFFVASDINYVDTRCVSARSAAESLDLAIVSRWQALPVHCLAARRTPQGGCIFREETAMMRDGKAQMHFDFAKQNEVG